MKISYFHLRNIVLMTTTCIYGIPYILMNRIAIEVFSGLDLMPKLSDSEKKTVFCI